MKRATILAMIVPASLFFVAVVGCEPLLRFIQPQNTTVRLVNNTGLEVVVDLYYDDEQNIPEFLLTEIGTHRTFTLAANDVQSFSVDCDQLQAIVISDADLQVIGSIGPDASTKVFRDGDDFGCGAVITFTFQGGVLDFNIAVAIVP